MEESKRIKEEYIFFANDESLIYVKKITVLAKLTKESGLQKKFFLYGRSGTIANNPDLIKLWKEAGFVRIFIGLEIFRDSDLQLIKKSRV